MKKSVVIVTILLGCGLAVLQIVQAQKSGGEINILEELGLSDIPAPPDISGNAAQGDEVFDATGQAVSQVSDAEADFSSSGVSEYDSVLTPLEELDGNLSSVEAFMQAVDHQRKEVENSEIKRRDDNSRIVESLGDSSIDADVLTNMASTTNGSIRILQTEPELIYVREDGTQNYNADAVKKLLEGSGVSSASQPTSQYTEVRAKTVTSISGASHSGSTSFAKDLMTDIGINGQSQSLPTRIYSEVDYSHVQTVVEESEPVSAWETYEKEHTTSASASTSASAEGLGFFPDSQTTQPVITKVESVQPMRQYAQVTTVTHEVSPEKNSASVSVQAPEPIHVEPIEISEDSEIGEEVDIDFEEDIDSTLDSILNEEIQNVSARTTSVSSSNAEVAPDYFDSGAAIDELVGSDTGSVNTYQFNSEAVDNTGVATDSPEVSDFLQKYGQELGYQSGVTQRSGASASPAVVQSASYNSFEPAAQIVTRLNIDDEDLLSASNEIVPFIAIDDAELAAAIRQLARQAGINFIFDPRVLSGTSQSGEPITFPKVTVRFENVTALQALEAVLDSYDLALEPNKKTRIAKVSFKRPPLEEPLKSEVIQLKYHSAEEMAKLLESFVSDRSSLQPHNKSSKIVVSATKEELEKVAELVYELDVPSKNVLIEANILETSRSPRSLRGIDWSGTFSNHQVSFGNGQSRGTQTQGQANNLTTTFDGNGLSLVTGSFSPDVAFLNSDGLNAVLNFLNSDTQTRVVATPRTVTQNAVEALLEVTRAFPIFQESPGSQAVPATTAIIYTNLGTILKVTPRISADDSVTLDVRPEVSNVDGKDQSQVGGRVSEANIYAIRRMETTVRVPSGHTLVMGGLTSDTRTRKQNKVPLLGDIPILGRAFQNKEKNQENQNLIVFITPTIVREDDYQESHSEFLNTRLNIEESDIRFDSMWDSAEPYSWGKKE